VFRTRLLAGAVAIAIGLGAVPAYAEVGVVGNTTGCVEGAGEGVWGGAVGTLTKVEDVGEFAINSTYRDDTLASAWDTTKAVGGFAVTTATDPRKAAGETYDAASGVWNGLATAFDQANAAGHGTEFVCRIGGDAAYAAAVAYLTGKVTAYLWPAVDAPPDIIGPSAPDGPWGPTIWEPPADPSWWRILLYRGARLGTSVREDWRETFRRAYPESKALVGEGTVHHAIPRQVLRDYPGLVTENEMHSLENLRGIPIWRDHEEITNEWRVFFNEHPPGSLTREQLFKKVRQIDAKYGARFDPPVLSVPESVANGAAEVARSLAEQTAETAKDLVEKAKDLVPSWGVPGWA